MIHQGKMVVIDIDGTICKSKLPDQGYIEVEPEFEIIEKLRAYKQEGFYLILYTSRQMRTYQGNIGKINANTAKVLFEWLDTHEVPYDEIHFGKPWCGFEGFYVDDKAIRPDEFKDLSYDQIVELLK